MNAIPPKPPSRFLRSSAASQPQVLICNCVWADRHWSTAAANIGKSYCSETSAAVGRRLCVGDMWSRDTTPKAGSPPQNASKATALLRANTNGSAAVQRRHPHPADAEKFDAVRPVPNQLGAVRGSIPVQVLFVTQPASSLFGDAEFNSIGHIFPLPSYQLGNHACLTYVYDERRASRFSRASAFSPYTNTNTTYSPSRQRFIVVVAVCTSPTRGVTLCTPRSAFAGVIFEHAITHHPHFEGGTRTKDVLCWRRSLKRSRASASWPATLLDATTGWFSSIEGVVGRWKLMTKIADV